MSNSRIGICALCSNPENSTFLQTVHTEELFNALLTRGSFDRKAMFCCKCIDYARQLVLYYRRNNQMNISATMNSPISDNASPEARGLETPLQSPDQNSSQNPDDIVLPRTITFDVSLLDNYQSEPLPLDLLEEDDQE